MACKIHRPVSQTVCIPFPFNEAILYASLETISAIEL